MAMKETAQSIIKRRNQAKARRSNWETLWDEIARYVMPNKEDFIHERSKGEKRGSDLYESTAVEANQLLAASMQGALTPSSARWFDFRFRSKALNSDEDARQWLQDCGDAVNIQFNQSNFDTESGETYLDLGSFGTAPLLFDIEEEAAQFSGFNFQSLHLGNVLIEQNDKGKVDVVFRTFKYNARQAIQKFGEDLVCEKIIKEYEKGSDKEFSFIQAIMPRKVENKPNTLLLAPEMRPFACYYVCETSKRIIKETGYYELPILVPRWGKITGDVYGFSPALTARPDIRTLNEARRLSFAAWEKSIDPPLISEKNNIMGKFSFKHSTVNYVRDINGIRDMPQGTNWSVDQLMLNDVRASVRRIFFADQLELQNGPQMTATEVEVRYELMQRMLGSTFGRLQAEFLTPLVERAFYAMFRGNALPTPPDVVLQEGGDLDIEYVGALARAQRMDEVTNIQRLADIGMGLSQVKPDVLDKFDADQAFEIAGQRLGVPAEVIVSDDKVAETRETRAAAQQQEAAALEEQAGLNAAEQMAGMQQ